MSASAAAANNIIPPAASCSRNSRAPLRFSVTCSSLRVLVLRSRSVSCRRGASPRTRGTTQPVRPTSANKADRVAAQQRQRGCADQDCNPTRIGISTSSARLEARIFAIIASNRFSNSCESSIPEGGHPRSDLMPTYIQLSPGDPAPWFHQRSFGNPRYAFDTAAGRYIVLCFFASAADAHSRAAVQAVLSRRGLFDDERASFFGVSLDPRDESEKRVADSYPGYRYFWDFDGTASRLYGVVPREAPPGSAQVTARRLWVVLDPTLRVLRVVPFADDRSDIPAVLAHLERLPPPARFAGFELQAPILVLPNVFEPEFCRQLIGLYEAHGGEESGFMREVGGKTVAAHDHGHKQRKDHVIEDQEVIG